MTATPESILRELVLALEENFTHEEIGGMMDLWEAYEKARAALGQPLHLLGRGDLTHYHCMSVRADECEWCEASREELTG